MGNKQVHWLAIVASMLATVWFAHQYATAPVPLPSALASSNSGVASPANHVVLRIPKAVAAQAPQPIAIDAALARRALKTGELRVALPDGTSYPVRIERQYTDKTGHWNVVGRVHTRLGEQPMVLTFGGNVVFGVLPTPDGDRMRIETGPAGEIQIGPDGGLLPDDIRGLALDDVVARPEAGIEQKRVAAAVPHKTSAASQRVRIATQGAVVSSMPRASAAAPVDTTPVDIVVLPIYTPEQLALRGDVATVETEIANLFALANQAHIDSGSRVRLQPAPAQLQGVNPTLSNQSALWDISLYSSAAAVAEMRNAVSADLVVLVRPHPQYDTCGSAYLASQQHDRTQAVSGFGFSVVNTDGPCHSLILAHETGHNFGAMHDREAETLADGSLRQGAYYFSYAYSNISFGTIMARPNGDTSILSFSNPADSPSCGGPCGVADYTDDVRTFNLMAPAIAAFRGTPGAIAAGDVDAVEPHYALRQVVLEVRLTGTAGDMDGDVGVDVVGGTATQEVDYFLPTQSARIREGESTAVIVLYLLSDQEDEPDETIELRLVAPFLPIADETVTVTIVEPQRKLLSGKLWFPEGATRPDVPIEFPVLGADDSTGRTTVTVSPPEFAFELAVPYGAQVQLEPQLPAPWVLWPRIPRISEVRHDRQWLVFPEAGARISGVVRPQAGMELPTSEFQFRFIEADAKGREELTWITVAPPDYAYAHYVRPGNDATIDTTLAPFATYKASYWAVREDVARDIVLGTRPTLRVVPARAPVETYDYQSGNVPAIILDGPAPPGGVTFRCRTVDGTAKAGTDFVGLVAFATVPEGQWGYRQCGNMVVRGNAQAPRPAKQFTVVIDQVQGADATTLSAPVFLTGPVLRSGGRQQKQAN